MFGVLVVLRWDCWDCNRLFYKICYRVGGMVVRRDFGKDASSSSREGRRDTR